MEVIARGLDFPEGPAIGPDGRLYVAENRKGQVSRIDDGEMVAFARTGGGPNGLAFGADGDLFVCNNGGLAWLPTGWASGPASDNQVRT